MRSNIYFKSNQSVSQSINSQLNSTLNSTLNQPINQSINQLDSFKCKKNTQYYCNKNQKKRATTTKATKRIFYIAKCLSYSFLILSTTTTTTRWRTWQKERNTHTHTTREEQLAPPSAREREELDLKMYSFDQCWYRGSLKIY